MDWKTNWLSQREGTPRRCTIGTKIMQRRRMLVRAHWTLWILFIGLQIADVATTNCALAVPGNWEVNPIMRLSQSHLGAAWWLPKVAAVGFAAFAVPQTFRPWPILFAIWYYVIVVSGNVASL
jgi:hypothetical protein